jgi:hypothetical protein
MDTEVIECQNDEQLKIWSVFQISLGSYLAGPIGAGYLLGQNFKAMGREDLAKKIRLAGAAFTFLLLLFLFLVPDEMFEKIPKMFVPIAYTAMVTAFAEGYQKVRIRELLDLGSKRNSYFKLIGIALVMIAIQIPLILLFAYLAELVVLS